MGSMDNKNNQMNMDTISNFPEDDNGGVPVTNFYERLETPSPKIDFDNDELDFNGSALELENEHEQLAETELQSILDSGNDNQDQEHLPRPASASSTASSIASTVLKKASSVFQGTSTAVQEVIKQSSLCVGGEVQIPKRAGSGPAFPTTDEYANFYPHPPDVASIPLRHIQSSPTQQHFDMLGNQPLMKRSVSTPLSFAQSKRGSAFGRVRSSTNIVGRRSSAFDPVGIQKSDSIISSKSFVSDASSNDDVSVTSSTLNAKAQRRIKERRRIRNNRHNTSSNVQDQYPATNDIKRYNSNLSHEGASMSDVTKTNPISYSLLEEEDSLVDELRGKESPSPIPFPAYHKFDDDDHPPPTLNVTMNSLSINSTSNPPLPTQPRRRNSKQLVLPTNSRYGGRSPSSQESSSLSKSTRSGQSTTNSNQSHNFSSCNRSVTSSVAEADREVRDTNRRELRRFTMDDDGTMSIQSIQSSDTTSTNPNAYLALTTNSPNLRDGATMPFDRFFARNPSGTMGANNGRPPSSMKSKSPSTTPSNGSTGFSLSSASTGDEAPPPRLFFKKNGIVPISDDMAYSKLGPDSKHGRSTSSSRSSSSKSSTKFRGNKVYTKMRASTPSPGPCNNGHGPSPVKTPKTPISPPNQFNFPPCIPADYERPHVHRQTVSLGNNTPNGKFRLVSPTAGNRVQSNSGVFQPTSTRRGVGFGPAIVSPNNSKIEKFIASSHHR